MAEKSCTIVTQQAIKKGTEEFACAIISACPYNTSIKAFVGILTSLGPKERNNHWLRVCQILRNGGDDMPVARKWRRWAHRYLIENILEIEQIIWTRIFLICHNEIIAVAAANRQYQLGLDRPGALEELARDFSTKVNIDDDAYGCNHSCCESFNGDLIIDTGAVMEKVNHQINGTR